MINEDDKEDIKETKEAIKKAQDKLEQISNDEHERYLAELREKYIRDQVAVQEYGYYKGKEEGIELGRTEGIAQGRTEQIIEIAKKMLEEKIDIKIIMKTTGLTEEEIKKLQD